MGGRGNKSASSSARRSSARLQAKSNDPTTLDTVEEADDSSSSMPTMVEESVNSSQELEEAYRVIMSKATISSGTSPFSPNMGTGHNTDVCLNPYCTNPICVQRIAKDQEFYREHEVMQPDGTIIQSPYIISPTQPHTGSISASQSVTDSISPSKATMEEEFEGTSLDGVSPRFCNEDTAKSSSHGYPGTTSQHIGTSPACEARAELQNSQQRSGQRTGPLHASQGTDSPGKGILLAGGEHSTPHEAQVVQGNIGAGLINYNLQNSNACAIVVPGDIDSKNAAANADLCFHAGPPTSHGEFNNSKENALDQLSAGKLLSQSGPPSLQDAAVPTTSVIVGSNCQRALASGHEISLSPSDKSITIAPLTEAPNCGTQQPGSNDANGNIAECNKSENVLSDGRQLDPCSHGRTSIETTQQAIVENIHFEHNAYATNFTAANAKNIPDGPRGDHTLVDNSDNVYGLLGIPISKAQPEDGQVANEKNNENSTPALGASLSNPTPNVNQPSNGQPSTKVSLEDFPPLRGKEDNTKNAQHDDSFVNKNNAHPCNVSTSWRGIFMGDLNSSLKLKFFEFEEKDGKPIACPPPEIFHAGATHWQRCLIGQFFDKPPPFFLIQRMVDTKWKKFGPVDIRSTESDMYVFQFETEAICDVVLEELWHVYHHPLLLRRWTPGTQLINLQCNRVPIWLKLIDVPLDLWDQDGLSYVSSTIGFPLQMDSLTASRRHLGYARVCVEMNVEKEFPKSTSVRLLDGSVAEIQIEYTWKPKKCTYCKVFGHNEVTCTAIPKETVSVPVETVSAPVQNVTQFEKVTKENEWKTATNVSKKNNKTSSTTAFTKNKFDVFSENPEIGTMQPIDPTAASTSQRNVANKNATPPIPGKSMDQARKNPKYPQKAYRNAQAIFAQRGRKSSDDFNSRGKNKIDFKAREKMRKDILQSISGPAHETDAFEGKN